VSEGSAQRASGRERGGAFCVSAFAVSVVALYLETRAVTYSNRTGARGQVHARPSATS